MQVMLHQDDSCSTGMLHRMIGTVLTLFCCSDLQARTVAVKSALQLVCSSIADKNTTALGEAVRNCPPENTTALSTALAQNAASEATCPTVASVCDAGWYTPSCSFFLHHSEATFCWAAASGIARWWCNIMLWVEHHAVGAASCCGCGTEHTRLSPLLGTVQEGFSCMRFGTPILTLPLFTPLLMLFLFTGCWFCCRRWLEHQCVCRGCCYRLRCWWRSGPGRCSGWQPSSARRSMFFFLQQMHSKKMVCDMGISI